MTPQELSRANHSFFVVTIPQRMFESGFEEALRSAAALAPEARHYESPTLLNQFRQYGWEDGYLGITVEAADIWIKQNIDSFDVASALYKAARNGVDNGIEVVIDGHVFVFEITDYETEDEQGFVRVDDPLALHVDARLDRRVLIRLKH